MEYTISEEKAIQEDRNQFFKTGMKIGGLALLAGAGIAVLGNLIDNEVARKVVMIPSGIVAGLGYISLAGSAFWYCLDRAFD